VRGVCVVLVSAQRMSNIYILYIYIYFSLKIIFLFKIIYILNKTNS
jgi:hypothetical protein